MTQHANATTGQRSISIFTTLQVSLNMAYTLFCAGWPANWLRLAFVYRRCLAVALGLPRMALSVGCADNGLSHWYCEGLCPFTLSRVVARQLGLLTQVRYPARGSARVTILKPNVKLTGSALLRSPS